MPEPAVLDRTERPIQGATGKVAGLTLRAYEFFLIRLGVAVLAGLLIYARLGQIILLLGGIISAFGMFVFTRRELATAQGTQ